MGLLVTSPALNAAIRKAVMPDFDAKNAWQLTYDSNGDLAWESEDTVLSDQPAASFMQRIEDWFFSHLPLEGEL